MKFKKSVKINGIKPEIVIAINVVAEVYKAHGKELVVTSVTDGKHSSGSLHYIGHAFDARTFIFEAYELELVKKDIREALTDEFDVVLEEDHFHIEFQPKS